MFTLQLLYELKHKVCLSKLCVEFSDVALFRFHFVFMKVYIFDQENADDFKTS